MLDGVFQGVVSEQQEHSEADSWIQGFFTRHEQGLRCELLRLERRCDCPLRLTRRVTM
jgi:hypothetical protein